MKIGDPPGPIADIDDHRTTRHPVASGAPTSAPPQREARGFANSCASRGGKPASGCRPCRAYWLGSRVLSVVRTQQRSSVWCPAGGPVCCKGPRTICATWCGDQASTVRRHSRHRKRSTNGTRSARHTNIRCRRPLTFACRCLSIDEGVTYGCRDNQQGGFCEWSTKPTFARPPSLPARRRTARRTRRRS